VIEPATSRNNLMRVFLSIELPACGLPKKMSDLVALKMAECPRMLLLLADRRAYNPYELANDRKVPFTYLLKH